MVFKVFLTPMAQLKCNVMVMTAELKAIIIPVPLPIASVFVPTHIADYIDPVFNYLFSFGRMYTDYLGVPFGILTACAVVFITRILAAPKSLRAWQGIWLSETN